MDVYAPKSSEDREAQILAIYNKIINCLEERQDELEDGATNAEISLPLLQDVTTALILWASDIRLEEGSLKTISGTATADLILAALVHIRDAIPELTTEKLCQVRYEILADLRGVVSMVRMAYASNKKSGPYKSIKLLVTQMANRKDQHWLPYSAPTPPSADPKGASVRGPVFSSARRALPPALAQNMPYAILRSPKIETLFVIVPGIGTPDPRQWRDDAGYSWIESIPSSSAPGLTAFTMPHSLNATDPNLWQSLIGAGDAFLGNLLWLIEHEKIGHCPIVLVGHSLGGLILKQALCSIDQSHHKDQLLLLKALAAIIFLGTPHCVRPERWFHYAEVVRTGIGTPRKRLMTSSEAFMLAQISTRFERARICVPVISLHETRPTEIRKSMSSIPQRVLLVDKESVRTGTELEVLIALDADHRTLCDLDLRGAGFQALCRQLTSALDKVRDRIIRGISPYDHPVLADDVSVLDESEWPDKSLPLRSGPDRNMATGPASIFSDTDSGSIYSGTDRTSIYSSADPQPNEDPALDLVATSRKGAAQGVRLPRIKLPCMMMPLNRNPNFYGRAKCLQALDDAYFGFDQSLITSQPVSDIERVRSFAICGPGGMGKTQLAVEWIYMRRDRFDAIFWVNADRAATIEHGFREIGTRLGLITDDSPDARDPVVSCETVRSWLGHPVMAVTADSASDTDRASWLIVFDNVSDITVLQDYWPLGGPGCILITSRNPGLKHSGLLAQSFTLDPLNDDEAAELLQLLTKRNEDAYKVVRKLGGHPLAIFYVAHVVTRRCLSFNEFLALYMEERNLTVNFGSHEKYYHNLASVCGLSSLRLASATLLELMAFLDPDSIDERIMTAQLEDARLKNYPSSTSEYYIARAELLQSSLIKQDVDSKLLSVHRLVQHIARSKLSPERYRETFLAAVGLVSWAWPCESFGKGHSVSQWQVCAELLPHVAMLDHLSRHFHGKLGEYARDLDFAALMTVAGCYCHERGLSEESMSFFVSAQEAAEEFRSHSDSMNSEHTLRAESLLTQIHHNIGCVASETNDLESTIMHFYAFSQLVLEQAVGPASNSWSAIAWNDLGIACMMRKEWEEARAHFVRSIEATDSRPSESSDNSLPMVNLGLAYCSLGQYEEAANILNVGLGRREETYGKDDTVSAISGRFLYALGNVKHLQGLDDESFELHQRALKQFLSTLGTCHHRTGDVFVKVSEHQLRLGRFSEALKELNKALSIFIRRPHIYLPEICRTHLKLSVVFRAMGGEADAQAAENQSLHLYQELETRAARFRLGRLSLDKVDELVTFWSR